jgi:Zn-dependent alcohol dehydrogenase
MRATAAVLYEVRKPVVVEDVEVMDPGPHEVLVRPIRKSMSSSASWWPN